MDSILEVHREVELDKNEAKLIGIGLACIVCNATLFYEPDDSSYRDFEIRDVIPRDFPGARYNDFYASAALCLWEDVAYVPHRGTPVYVDPLAISLLILAVHTTAALAKKGWIDPWRPDFAQSIDALVRKLKRYRIEGIIQGKAVPEYAETMSELIAAWKPFSDL